MIINEKNKAEKGTESAGSMIQGLREGDSKQSSQERAYSGIILVCIPEVASYNTQGNSIPNKFPGHFSGKRNGE